MNLGLGGNRVLVTAGASGIGRTVADTFLREGAKVFVCDVDEQALATLDPAIGRIVADVANRDSVAALFKAALAHLGGLDTLVNNAGIAGPTGRVEEIAPEDWDRCLQVNITGQYNCARLAIAALKESGNASIVNLASAAGKFGFGLRTPYAASKWAVVGFTKSLAIELGAFGIRANAILPGMVDGPRIRRVVEAKAAARNVPVEQQEADMLSYVSLGSMVTHQQLADFMCFIASPLGRTISGQALSVDGDTRMLS